MTDTKIQWTDKSWNPVRGCSRVSKGCDNCYAMGVAHRFSGKEKPYEGLTTIRKGKVDWTGTVRFAPNKLGEPLTWKKPQRIFVNSMSDLFHESLTNEEIAAVFGVMAACPQHTFQLLTKRPERMKAWFEWVLTLGGNPWTECHWLALATEHPEANGPIHTKSGGLDDRPWPLPNVHLGVSIEDQKTAEERIPILLDTPAALRFVSAEPLLGPIDFSRIGNALFDRDAAIRKAMNGPAAMNREQAESAIAYPQLGWGIVGGESGTGARPCDVGWVRSIVRQFQAASVPCFLKQLGRRPFEEGVKFEGCILTDGIVRRLESKKGDDMRQWPSDLQVREFPEGSRK